MADSFYLRCDFFQHPLVEALTVEEEVALLHLICECMADDRPVPEPFTEYVSVVGSE